MAGEPESRRALDDLRVLNLTDRIDQYCGRVLASLGADVIRIEPPDGGDPRRAHPVGPHYSDREVPIESCGPRGRSSPLTAQNASFETLKVRCIRSSPSSAISSCLTTWRGSSPAM